MAHTAIRLGYISVSIGEGDTDNFKEYSDLESFPPSGQLNTIYLANDTKKIYKWNGLTYQELSPSEVTSVNTQVGDVVLTKDDVGLDQVDNTSDLDKPISTATQNALDDKEDLINKSDNETLSEDSSTLYPTQHAVKNYVDTGLSAKIDSSEKGAANGVAPLNSSTKIDSIYLPSYVDDVEEYADLASFPITGESGKIYVALDTNLVYRWSGSTYVEISPAPVQSVNGQTNVVVLDSTDLKHAQIAEENWDIPTNSTISASLEELAARAYGISQVTNEPTGFTDRTSSELTFSDSTPDRTLIITPVTTHFD